jgi:hypothetical protein
MAKRTQASVYVFKVALQGAKKIWRRIAVRSDQSLDDLHSAIFDAFDRDDEHLYSFYFRRPGATPRSPLRDAVEYTHPESAEASGEKSAADAIIGKLGLKPDQKFVYVFDFRDDWRHEVTVESVEGPLESVEYPLILEKNGKSPPQYPDLDDEE